MIKKRETIREQIAVLRTENLEQTKKIDRLISVMDKHEESSYKFREKVTNNATSINIIKKESLPILRKLIFALYGLLGSVMIAMIIYFLNK